MTTDNAASTRRVRTVRVGNSQTVNLCLHVRRCDLEWFNNSCWNECLRLLETEILPRVVGRREELEQQQQKQQEEEEQDEQEEEEKSSSKKKKTIKKNKKNHFLTDKQRDKQRERVQQRLDRQEENAIHYAWSDQDSNCRIQLSYRVRNNHSNSATTLVVVPSKETEVEKSTSITKWKALKSLPFSIVAWCYPYTDDLRNQPDPSGGGFPRPEMSSLEDLFPPEEEDVEQEASSSSSSKPPPAKRKKTTNSG